MHGQRHGTGPIPPSLICPDPSELGLPADCEYFGRTADTPRGPFPGSWLQPASVASTRGDEPGAVRGACTPRSHVLRIAVRECQTSSSVIMSPSHPRYLTAALLVPADPAPDLPLGPPHRPYYMGGHHHRQRHRQRQPLLSPHGVAMWLVDRNAFEPRSSRLVPARLRESDEARARGGRLASLTRPPRRRAPRGCTSYAGPCCTSYAGPCCSSTLTRTVPLARHHDDTRLRRRHGSG